jgi:hypothetical protein
MCDASSHFDQLYTMTQREFAFRTSSRAEWLEWREAFRPRLQAALGLHNMGAGLAGHKPEARMLAREDVADHVRELWHLWVEPTVPLPVYVLRPKKQAGSLPLVLAPHGHNHPHVYVGIARDESEAKSISEGERDIAVQAVQEGYLAIAPTTRGFGDTRTEQDRAEGSVSSCRT